MIILFIFFIILSFNDNTEKYEFEKFIVVIDPGHGGKALYPIYLHGDKYSFLLKKYLQIYHEGACYKDYRESEIAFKIAKKVRKILSYASVDGDYKKFYKILKKYTNNVKRIYIEIHLSREGEGVNFNEKDPNSHYRLYDYPDIDSKKVNPGRISYINSLKPHLIVSLHFGNYPPKYYRGLSPVIVAPYSFLYKGFLYLLRKNHNKDFFYNSKYSDWFIENSRKSSFYWFCSDTSIYFTGFGINKNYNINIERFEGYRYNMVTWKYADGPGWVFIAKKHPCNSCYAIDYKCFLPDNKFFKREKSLYESYRRENGYEGYGGDNLYASNEIIRYILYSLSVNKLKKKDHKYLRLAPPYISVWSLPLYVNAVTAFIELGYLKHKYTRYLIKYHIDDISEGIAVGIYSLLTGIEVKNNNIKYRPKGKKIDLNKYMIDNEKSYFEIVAD